MSLAVGTRLGQYEIVAPLGKGGMGEVYRARDSKLGRDVAIKVLPEELARDADRLSRFEREARLLAQLSHSNVATLYGLDEAEGCLFLAMELVEGETLAERIARGPIPLEEAIPIFLQIADGLDAAHEKGIIHRDLKPANVKLTPSDEVKILDFGLAKAYADDAPEADSSMSPTITRNATGAGVILGTAAFMSPEQAKGKRVDKRTDVWSFGVVLYEALTGKRLFQGETVSDVLAAVLTRSIDLAAVPASVRPLLTRCLDRDPRKRLRDIGEARIALEMGPSSESEHRGRSRLRAAIPWTLAALFALVTIVLGFRDVPRSEVPVRRFSVDLPWHTTPNWTDFIAHISPDGKYIAYQGRVDNDVTLQLRPLDSLEAGPIADARELGPYELTFSPDSEWVLFADNFELYKVSIRGGAPQLVASFEERQAGLSWGEEGDILRGSGRGLYRLSSEGDGVELLTTVDTSVGEAGHLYPHHLPGGKAALMSVVFEEGDPRLAVVDLETGRHRILPVVGEVPIYSSTGHILYRLHAQETSSVNGVAFDPEKLTVESDPFPVLEDVRYGPQLSDDGTMLYVPERGDSSARLVWVDRQGRPTPVDVERLDYSHLDLSRSGDAALLNIGDDVYFVDLDRGTRRLLGSGSFPIFSVDGTYATFQRFPLGLHRQPSDGSSEGELLLKTDVGVGTLVPSSWSPSTGELAFFDSASDVWILPPDGEPAPFLSTRHNERSARFSPDGQWVAYVSDETGAYQVYVVPYPGPGPKTAVSIDGGLSPIWSRDGRELFFRRGSKLMVASVAYDPAIRFGHPVVLFDGPYNPDFMGHQRYDVSPDGKRFLMVENSDDFRIIIVQNWIEELERLYVEPFPGPRARVQISTRGGRSPLWSRDGRELFYWQGGFSEAQLMRVPVVSNASENDGFQAGAPQRLMDNPVQGTPVRATDISLDGKRFLRSQLVPGEKRALPDIRELRVVVGWSSELTRLVP
ncbi:MAG TPA: protein kinase [Vicinamibacteria bacterium]|nr:protein kinase [Vicinamibacteria bacterium]